MTIEQLKAAYAAGARIQIRHRFYSGFIFVDEWVDITNPTFDGLAESYQVKPKGAQ